MKNYARLRQERARTAELLNQRTTFIEAAAMVLSFVGFFIILIILAAIF